MGRSPHFSYGLGGRRFNAGAAPPSAPTGVTANGAAATDAWREGDKLVVEIDLPGVQADSLDVRVDHDVLTVRAEHPEVTGGREWLAAERPHGAFTRQLYLGQSLDTEQVSADYTDGVLRITIPVAEAAKPRKVAIATGAQQAINA
ncbi:heat-shock protein Hsp18 [Mycobacterium sp. 1164966.3]|uniref:Hsp20/alpha crystallin family protein n=1 Tax=Mycobacterium sp. 1164966.3 TaxID=1856861 RepID=UPI0007FF5FC5|nr:HSP20 family small heat-shock protein [Mycobacterium sp. 1164966.3]OBA80282.1 heat-shock protein Hsp18 [Mycobacterium sp. 1164966.3]